MGFKSIINKSISAGKQGFKNSKDYIVIKRNIATLEKDITDAVTDFFNRDIEDIIISIKDVDNDFISISDMIAKRVELLEKIGENDLNKVTNKINNLLKYRKNSKTNIRNSNNNSSNNNSSNNNTKKDKDNADNIEEIEIETDIDKDKQRQGNKRQRNIDNK